MLEYNSFYCSGDPKKDCGIAYNFEVKNFYELNGHTAVGLLNNREAFDLAVAHAESARTWCILRADVEKVAQQLKLRQDPLSEEFLHSVRSYALPFSTIMFYPYDTLKVAVNANQPSDRTVTLSAVQFTELLNYMYSKDEFFLWFAHQAVRLGRTDFEATLKETIAWSPV